LIARNVVGCVGILAIRHVADRNQFRECRFSQSRHTHFFDCDRTTIIDDSVVVARLAQWAI
jgi:hypothetical protein